MNRPKDLISLAKFSKMLHQTQNRNNTPTESVWVGIAKLKEYITFIEQESTAKEIDVSGMRIHFVRNSDGQTTLAFSPTFLDASDRGEMPHVSFDPLHSTRRNPAVLSELLKNNNKGSEESSVLNGMNTCPSVCNNK